MKWEGRQVVRVQSSETSVLCDGVTELYHLKRIYFLILTVVHCYL